jgi:ankyrin repeat protein
VNAQHPATEEHDRQSKGPFKRELTGYTPVQLACISPKSKKAIVEVFFEAKIPLTDLDSDENSLLHLAAMSNGVVILEYLLTNVQSLDLFARNAKRETPLSIAVEHKHTEATKVIETYMA